MALYNYAIGNTATMTTSEYTNRQNELMDEVHDKEEDKTTVPASNLSSLSPSPPGTERGHIDTSLGVNKKSIRPSYAASS
ncbi:hypothetical protein SNOG_16430 [Parastagonospora nodorum SN15]|uniref:Uncharacterized protein n=1 Tax=Phaeosphaeria nodorum (strain SN15 / ATCC MYA-4574 / FGSC 10173) TaxID=321614 RepID=Q0TVN4_PHANO|nr:hypothetical protein SNOG_16430 [Parastagonospora nodorum SN15]EAT76128.1 hypothetical protein SNOG_16430 [Parastagonospora nodorum SN15]